MWQIYVWSMTIGHGEDDEVKKIASNFTGDNLNRRSSRFDKCVTYCVYCWLNSSIKSLRYLELSKFRLVVTNGLTWQSVLPHSNKIARSRTQKSCKGFHEKKRTAKELPMKKELHIECRPLAKFVFFFIFVYKSGSS